ncbi:5-formyltetrahydrofolate cyclo-ligase [Moraxella caviae]|uniref:5-formyltetrahydrofolate cyclo-ligase n=2 Tax=Moraxella caviae TaxID=34060 RepID=A0A1T0A8A7_9GAMM|nr:5-formyltetrahydrofolate cyclo-ligase [Moraxella caviae]STZ14386.1 5-formyltetrahydrofolate cyclo-ligase family protein [Moraxella caviae]VEW10528.1 5-formyltetrahydrofolate cyclo-ligase family protein [Moraxella caviae]
MQHADLHRQTRRQIRKHIQKQRRQLTTHARQYSAFLVSLQLRKLLPLLPKHAKIGIYLDSFGELPTAPLVQFCLRHGFTPFLPITTAHKPLRFAPMRFAHGKTPLRTHALGMKEPTTKPIVSADMLDAIICPLVAADTLGNRLGMGGGFYDRTFSSAKTVLKIGYCYDFQVMERLPVTNWDQKLNLLLTPSKVRYFG